MTPWSHQVLPAVSRGYPRAEGTLPMYSSPFRHCTIPVAREFPCDLHVLATPPAFVLSQDQTLHLMIVPPRGANPEGVGSIGRLTLVAGPFRGGPAGPDKSDHGSVLSGLNSKSFVGHGHEDFERQVLARGPAVDRFPASPAMTGRPCGHILVTASLLTFQ